jgi:hypothetical protein
VLALEEAATALGDEDTPTRARVLASLARELAWNGVDVPRATRLAPAAVATARRVGDPATLAACLVAQHNTGWGPGNAAERLALAGQVAELAAQTGDLELAAEAGLLRMADLLELGDPAVHAELTRFLLVAETLRQPRLRYAALTRRAMQALLAGRLGEAERLVAEAAALARELGEPDAGDVEQVQLWELRGLQGRRAEVAEQTRALFPDDSVQAHYYQAMVLLERGDRAGAEAAAGPLAHTDPAALPKDRIWTLGLAFASELVVALGDRAGCQRVYDALAPLAGGAAVAGAAVAFRGAVAHYLGLLAATLGHLEEAKGHLERALAVHERLGAHPWILTTRYELARVLLGEPAARDRARALLAQVAAAAGRLGLAELAGRAGEALRQAEQAPAARGVFRRDGTLWTLGYAGRTVRMRDAKGLRDLATLLAAPGRPVHAAELAAGPGSRGAGLAALRLGADEVLDERARRELRARLGELEEEIEQAERWSDPERAARARQERDALVEELAAAAGLGGRARRLDDPSERARKAVTARIRDVIARVERLHPDLGAHLRASVTTGTFCGYSPAAPTAWELQTPRSGGT